MNTRRLTKKYKNKSRSKRSRKSRRRVLKGGVPSVSRPSSRASTRPSSRPSSGIIVSRTSGRGSSGRASSGSVRHIPGIWGISKPPNKNFNFECFYNKLMRTDENNLPNIIECEKDKYVCNTTIGDINPTRAFLNMNGLKFVSYLHGKYKNGIENEKKKIERIVSLFDQCNMSQGVRIADLNIIEGQVDKRYFACYEKLYSQIYKKLFPNGNSECYPVSTSAVKLDPINEDE